MGRIDGPSAGKIFHRQIWGGADESGKRVLFCGIRSEWIHGIVSHRVYFENCAEFGNEVHVCFSREINREVKKSLRRGQGEVSNKLRAGVHPVRFKRSSGGKRNGHPV